MDEYAPKAPRKAEAAGTGPAGASLPDPVADAYFVIDFADGALFVANLDFDPELWTALRAIRRPRDEGRHELLTAIRSRIGRRMAGQTPAGELKSLAGEIKKLDPMNAPAESDMAKLMRQVDPVADAHFVIDFADGALFVANLDFDPELWTALRAIRHARDEGRHELLSTIRSWIGRRMAGQTPEGEMKTLAGEMKKLDPMKTPSSSRAKKSPRAVVKQAPTAPPEELDIQKLLRQAGGGHCELGEMFVSQARNGSPVPDLAALSPEDRRRRVIEVAGFVENIAPADVLESALSAQLCAAHNLGMRLLRKASRGRDDDAAGVQMGRALRLIAAFQRGLEALDRHRGRGRPQTVRVEHVHVNAGGQAIVGAVEVKGGGKGRSPKT